MTRKKIKLPDVTWIEWMRESVSNLGNNWCGGPSQEYHDQAEKALQEAEAAWAATSTPAVPDRHLWEYEHPYVGPEGSSPQHHESWEDFLGTKSDTHRDYNLLFRWDWVLQDAAWCEEMGVALQDPPRHVLHLFFVRQRRGGVGCESVDVVPADEPAVRAWLADRVAYLMTVNEGV